MDRTFSDDITSYIERERDFLRGRAIGLARKTEDADDLYQDTVMKAFIGWRSFDPDTNFRAWIGRIMLNTHINNFNQRRDNPIYDFSSGKGDNALFHSAGDGDVSYNDSPEKIFFSKHIDGRIMGALYSLPDSFRVPFSLYHFEGCSYDEIAERTGLPIGTVKSRIFRARRMLKNRIERESRRISA